MFLEVKVPQQECRALRFLWRSEQEDKIGVYEYSRHDFGAKSCPMSANYVFLPADADNKDNHSIAAKAMKINCHLDDFAKSVATVEEAVHVYQDVGITL